MADEKEQHISFAQLSKEHVSFTQLNCFLRCGIQFYRRYICGHIIPPAGSQMRGRCCHKAEANNFRHKIESKEFLPSGAVVDSFITEWDANEHQIGWTEEDLQGESPKKVAGKIKDSGVRLVKVFEQEQIVNCHPVHIEDEFTVQFEGGYLPLVGIIDRIDEQDIIAEMKFVGKSPAANDILTDSQLSAYNLGFLSKFGKSPSKLIKQFAIDTKTPRTVLQECPPRDKETIERFLCRLESFMNALDKGVFLPAQPGWWCSEKFCGFWSSCKVKP